MNPSSPRVQTPFSACNASTRRLKSGQKAAKIRSMAKSHIAQKAFEMWLKKETEILMAKGYEDMAEEDGIFAEQALEALKEILS